VSYVPIFLDIDNEEHNLEDASTLTRDCLDLLEGITQYHAPDRLRVVFSGMNVTILKQDLLDSSIIGRFAILYLANWRRQGYNIAGLRTAL